jgi:hypothetical protein
MKVGVSLQVLVDELSDMIVIRYAVLTMVSVYWFSRAGPAASLRIYYEHLKTGGDFSGPKNVKIPIGYSYFSKELVMFPRQ